MQYVRIVVWVVLLIAYVAFSYANWDHPVSVQIWTHDLRWYTNAPALVTVAFLVGFVPMWLLHFATKWALRRRVTKLEATARQTATIPVAAPAPVTEREADPVVTPAEHPASPVHEERREGPPRSL